MGAVGEVDLEAELIPWLHSKLGSRVLTDLPADLDDVLPIVQVQRIGGSDDSFRLDRALVDVDTYASSRQAASQLLSATRALVLGQLPGAVTTAAVFTAARTISAPAWRPYENQTLRRFGATFELFFHSVS